MALQTGCAGTLGCLAQLTDRIVPKCWCSYSLHHVEARRAAELDLGMPDCTVYVHPVVVGSALERFPGYKRSALFLLSEAVLVLSSVNKFLLQTLLFAITIGLLFVRNLRLFIELLLGILLWTENTLVRLASQ